MLHISGIINTPSHRCARIVWRRQNELCNTMHNSYLFGTWWVRVDKYYFGNIRSTLLSKSNM